MGLKHRYKEISTFRKSFDVITNRLHYPIASSFCALIAPTKVTPNMVTTAAILAELYAVCLILTGFSKFAFFILILLQIGWTLDLMDGMLARYKKLGFYHPTNPSLKGFYLDAVSDHIMKFLTLGSLAYVLSGQMERGWIIGIAGIIIHAIVQTEHTLRLYIGKIAIKNGHEQRETKNNLRSKIALLMNNIYVFYLIFIPMNRIDLLFIFFAIGELILFFKRMNQFWKTNP